MTYYDTSILAPECYKKPLFTQNNHKHDFPFDDDICGLCGLSKDEIIKNNSSKCIIKIKNAKSAPSKCDGLRCLIN